MAAPMKYMGCLSCTVVLRKNSELLEVTRGNAAAVFSCADSQGRAQVRAGRRAASVHNQTGNVGSSRPPQPPGMGVSSERDRPCVHQPPGALCVTDTLPPGFLFANLLCWIYCTFFFPYLAFDVT